MRRVLSLLAISAGSTIGGGCVINQNGDERRASSTFTAAAHPLATISVIGADTLSDSARIYHLQPEPDGGSIAFLFADPAKGVAQGLGIVQTSGSQTAQLGWPDSVTSVWWSDPHQLSFTAGTGRGVHLVVDAHAAELKTVDVASGGGSAPIARSGTDRSGPNANAQARAQAFIDSIRVQPEGTPQYSALRYRADSILVGPGDTVAAVHVSAADLEGSKVNPAWYLVHLPTGHMQAVDSLTGRSFGLSASAGQWGADGSFYYAKERSIWRVQANVR